MGAGQKLLLFSPLQINLHATPLPIPQLLAILGTELIRAFSALQGCVGVIPKALGIHHYAKLPHQPCDHRHDQQGAGKKTICKDQRGKHHQVIPVKDPTGGTAAVFHDQPEGAPDQHANQVADVKQHRDHKQRYLVDYAPIIQQPDPRDQKAPKDKNLISGLSGGHDIASQGFMVDLVPYGPKMVGKELLRAYWDFIFNGDDLKEHIYDPYRPQKMQRRKSFKKVHSVEHKINIRLNQPRPNT